MKKSILLTVLCSLLLICVHAQDNKPEANSFGMQYGVNFNGSVGQAVQLSGWIKKGVEIRGSLAFNYSSSQTSSVSNGNYWVYSPDGRQLPALETSTSSSASLTVTPTISVVKHIPLKSNLDFFGGGSVAFGFTTPTSPTRSSNTQIADSFYSYSSTSSKSPLVFNWGLSLVGGANYFFYKNLALGADFGIGFTASNGNGSTHIQQVEVNSGLNNSSTVNYNKTFTNSSTNTRYSASLTGNAGLHLTYYLKVKSKQFTGPQPNPHF